MSDERFHSYEAQSHALVEVQRNSKLLEEFFFFGF